MTPESDFIAWETKAKHLIKVCHTGLLENISPRELAKDGVRIMMQSNLHKSDQSIAGALYILNYALALTVKELKDLKSKDN